MSREKVVTQGLRLSPFLLLCAAGFFDIVELKMAKNPVLPLFAKDLGAREADIGFIAAASTVVGIFTSVPAGALSNLYGRRRVILAAAFVFASAPFLRECLRILISASLPQQITACYDESMQASAGEKWRLAP